MTDLTNYRVTDYLVEALAVQYNRVIDATVRGEMANIETLAANKTLVDADFTLQVYSPTAARTVTLPAEASANHPFAVINISATYSLTIKNDAGDTIGTVSPASSGNFVSDSINWHSLGGGGGALPSNDNPLANGTAAPGTAATFSRSDHVHPGSSGGADLAEIFAMVG